MFDMEWSDEFDNEDEDLIVYCFLGVILLGTVFIGSLPLLVARRLFRR